MIPDWLIHSCVGLVVGLMIGFIAGHIEGAKQGRQEERGRMMRARLDAQPEIHDALTRDALVRRN